MAKNWIFSGNVVKRTRYKSKRQAQVTQYQGVHWIGPYRLQYDNADLILRRPPKGTKAKSAHDMEREYNVQKHLHLFYPVPPGNDGTGQDENVIGCDFYVMKRIEALFHAPIYRKNYS